MDAYVGVLRNYAVFNGRAPRSEFWLFTLVNLVVALVLGILGTLVAWIVYLEVLFALAVLVPSIAVTVRRLHDTGRSGWWYFIVLIPLIGLIVLIIFLVQGSDEDNEYDPRPTAHAGA